MSGDGTEDEFFSEDRTAGRAEAVRLPTGSYREYLLDPEDPVVAQYRGQRYDEYSTERVAPSFVQELLADWRALYDEPFRGVTSDGHVVEDLYPTASGSVPSSDDAPREAARRLLAQLSDAQRRQVRYPLDAPEWRAWSNPEFVIHDVGLRLEDLPEDAVAAAFRLLQSSLSPEGYDRVRELMSLNALLGRLVDLPTVMNERSYSIAVFGSAEGDGPFGWQLFGHHVAVNFVTVDGRDVIAPVFLGAEPAVLDDGRTGVFEAREAIAVQLASSLTSAQRARAVVYDSVLDPAMPSGRLHPADERHLAGAFRDNRVIPLEGINASELDTAQRGYLLAIVEDFLALLRAPQRTATMADVERHLDATFFAWYGATDGSQPFYFRIQSPVILAELDHHAGVWLANRLPARFHVHTTLRLPNGNDYGKAYLAQRSASTPFEKENL